MRRTTSSGMWSEGGPAEPSSERISSSEAWMSPHELTEGVGFACDVLGQEILVADVGESGVVQR